jgi:hypothetical protein
LWIAAAAADTYDLSYFLSYRVTRHHLCHSRLAAQVQQQQQQ